MFIALFKKCQVHQGAGYYWTVSPQWMFFCNPRLLTNIRDVKWTLNLDFNEGKAVLTKKGDLEGYSTVWFYPQGIANILSMYNVQKYKETYDCSAMTRFIVHKSDGISCVFIPSKKGLFYSDLKGDIAHVLINTVDKNENKYTVNEYAADYKARSLKDIIAIPSTKDFIEYVENIMLPNYPVTKAEILHVEDILRPDLGSLIGKTTRKTP